MKDKMKTAIDMIAAGHDVETVVDILGIDPEELYEVLVSMLGDSERVYITQSIEHFNTQLLGHFAIDMN